MSASNTPTISVIIPTYNRSACVGDAIRSVLAQTHQADEVIVVDDGSTDNTPESLSSFGSAIRVIRQSNAGVSAARNAGIRAASSDWLAFLDSDDLWMPERLERFIINFTQNPTIVGQIVDALVDGYSDEPISMFTVRSFKEQVAITPFRASPLNDVLSVQFFTSTWALQRAAVLSCGMFPTDLNIYEDLSLLSKVATRGPFAVDNYGGARMRRVLNVAKALSDQHLEMRARATSNLCRIYAELLKETALSTFETREVKRRLSGARFELATVRATDGSSSEAARLRWQSIKDDPCLRSLVRATLGLVGCTVLWHKLSSALKRQGPEFRRSTLDAAKKSK